MRGWFFATTIVLMTTHGSAAQLPASTTPPPQRTTATYDDWTVRCEVRDAAKSCEMVQTMQIQGQSQPVTQIAIGRLTKSDPLKIVFQVPINVWLPAEVKLKIDDKDSGLLGSYRRCLPTSCFADTDLKDDLVKKFTGLTENGKLQFKDASQQEIAIPVSFKGFGQAYEALQKP
jgi:invasion protein IalB